MNASSSSPSRSGAPAVVLLSGGLDSATVLAVARRDGFACHTLAFDYGQRHRHELAAAAQVSASLGAASHRVFSLDLRAFGGSALTADIAVPKDRALSTKSSGGVPPGLRAGDIPITYVPARNLIFLSIATGYAETLSAHDLFIGVNAVDYSGYPDCRPAFIEAFERAATLGTRAADSGPRVSVHAPLVNLTKAQIIRLGASAGVDYSLTHSCYDPVVRNNTTLACGHCDSCILRRDGFIAAQLPDPTRYA